MCRRLADQTSGQEVGRRLEQSQFKAADKAEAALLQRRDTEEERRGGTRQNLATPTQRVGKNEMSFNKTKKIEPNKKSCGLVKLKQK